MIGRFVAIGALALMPLLARTEGVAPIHHFVFYGMDRDALHKDSVFLRANGFAGAQVSYTWKQLERGKGEYDFSLIREDLELLERHGKKLWIQLQDVTFANHHIPVPPYLVNDAAYNGGVAQQYHMQTDDESKAVAQGWAVRRWDPAVQGEFHKLLAALGREFDGRIEGINFAETSVIFGTSGRMFPAGFSHERYRDAVIENMRALKRAFPKSVTLIYANFMPGEWRATNDRGYLVSVYRAARELGVGVGGPDLMPYRPGQVKTSYPLIRESAGIVPVGIAVQDGNLEEKNPKTGARVAVKELIDFASNDLGVNYMFWGTQEPFYSTEVIPLLNAQHD